MINQFELIFVFLSVMVGVVAATYFYISAGVFAHLKLLRHSLQLISGGVFIIAIGVLLAAFISFEAGQGFVLLFYGVPLQVFFYALYIIGSVLISVGAHSFTRRTSKV